MALQGLTLFKGSTSGKSSTGLVVAFLCIQRHRGRKEVIFDSSWVRQHGITEPPEMVYQAAAS